MTVLNRVLSIADEENDISKTQNEYMGALGGKLSLLDNDNCGKQFE